jgi:hypothetical protein
MTIVRFETASCTHTKNDAALIPNHSPRLQNLGLGICDNLDKMNLYSRFLNRLLIRVIEPENAR